MKLLPSVMLKLFLAAVLSALVTGESLERLREVWRQQPATLTLPLDPQTSCYPREVIVLRGSRTWKGQI